MRNRIDTRVAARLAAAALAVSAALTPITAAAAAHDLCDGHKWSLFGCRHHQVEQSDAAGLSLVGSSSVGLSTAGLSSAG